jgi:H+/Cl- antiporter ClcA
MLPFAFLGMIGGVVGSGIMKCIKRYCLLRKTHRIGDHPITEAVLVTLLTAVSSYSFRQQLPTRALFQAMQSAASALRLVL